MKSQNLSFSELHILLEQRKPFALPASKPGRFQTTVSVAERELSLQDRYHYERLNYTRSVRAEIANDGVLLSATCAIG